MKTATVYVAVDGRQFSDPAQCSDHENRLFNAWLKDNPVYMAFLKSDADEADNRRTVLAEL